MDVKSRQYFVYMMSVMYLFAFGSWFPQLPGLYGPSGIIPVENKEEYKNSGASWIEKIMQHPSILHIFVKQGWTVFNSLQLTCLLGATLSFLGLLSSRLRNSALFLCLWILYFSLYQAGDTFAHFQWDILLLEVGFLTIFVAPIPFVAKETSIAFNRLSFWLVRWCLFRLMFASGIVKLTSGCPTWWKLTALNYHFETQCIPTPLSWWAHQFPDWSLKLSVVATYVIEIAFPFLFLMPSRKLRLIGGYGQIFFMVTIILTGNYNFFNLLTCVMCLSCMDDQHVNWSSRKKSKKIVSFLSKFFNVIVLSTLAYQTAKWFSLTMFHNGHFIYSKIAFTNRQFQTFVDEAVLVAMWFAGLWFVYEFVATLISQLARSKNMFITSARLLCVGIFCAYMLTISMVPLNYNVSRDKKLLWPITHKWHNHVHQYGIVNSYGLFRRMTGVGGRPEVIIEGRMNADITWKEYHFLYKPGDVSSLPPFILPHQPRLDWQMWFAALGSYNHNPWLISLAYRLLQGQHDVLALLDVQKQPFHDKPPDVVRAQLYHYHLTALKSDGTFPRRSWRRKLQGEYFPELTRNDKHLHAFLQRYNKIIMESTKQNDTGVVMNAVSKTHQVFNNVSIPVMLWTMWCTALLIKWSTNLVLNKTNKIL